MKTYSQFALCIALGALSSGVAAAQGTGGNPTSPSSTAAPSWSQYGFQAAHQSLNSLENVLTRSNVSSLTWKSAAEVGAPIASAPIVSQGVLYVAAGGGCAVAYHD